MSETWSICTCPTGYRPQGYRESQSVTVCYGDAQGRAARLIVAAPDMLAMLKRIDALVGYDPDTFDDLRSLITRIEGEPT